METQALPKSNLQKGKAHIRFAFHVLVHPFDGFYDIRHENRGRLIVVWINLLLVGVSFSFLKQYVGFPFQTNDISLLNSFFDMVVLLVIFFLFCLANWSATTLMSGEGRFKDIVKACGYALTPINILLIPATLISRVLAVDEGAFYLMLIYLAVIWFAFLMFVGILTIHNYTALRTVAAFVFTIAAALIIIFLSLLVIMIFTQITGVLSSLYKELSYRT